MPAPIGRAKEDEANGEGDLGGGTKPFPESREMEAAGVLLGNPWKPVEGGINRGIYPGAGAAAGYPNSEGAGLRGTPDVGFRADFSGFTSEAPVLTLCLALSLDFCRRESFFALLAGSEDALPLGIRRGEFWDTCFCSVGLLAELPFEELEDQESGRRRLDVRLYSSGGGIQPAVGTSPFPPDKYPVLGGDLRRTLCMSIGSRGGVLQSLSDDEDDPM